MRNLMLTALPVLVTVLALAQAVGAGSGAAKTIDYGGSVLITGTAPSGGLGEVTVEAKACMFDSYAEIAKVPVKDGKFSYVAGPTVATTFRVSFRTQALLVRSVRVRPLVKLTRISPTRYRVEVTTANGTSFDGKSLSLQRRAVSGAWRTVKLVKLKLVSAPDQVNAVSAGTVSLVPLRPLRAAVTATQAAPCYAAAVSPVLTP